VIAKSKVERLPAGVGRTRPDLADPSNKLQ
jgi:hypothetical protein